MREILFRARAKNGGWRFGSGVTDFLNVYPDRKGCFYLWSDYSWIEIEPETLGQYTGLNDSKEWHDLTSKEKDNWRKSGKTAEEWEGKKIFEGDIMSVALSNPTAGRNCIVEFSAYYAGWVLSIPNTQCCYAFNKSTPNNIKIIGNIHDNPELLI